MKGKRGKGFKLVGDVETENGRLATFNVGGRMVEIETDKENNWLKARRKDGEWKTLIAGIAWDIFAVDKLLG